MKLYMFVVALFVSFIIGCGGAEEKPAEQPEPDVIVEGEEEVIEAEGSGSDALETLPETTTEKPKEEEETGLVDPGISIDPIAPTPGGGDETPAPAAGGDETPAPDVGMGTETPAPTEPAADPLAPAPAAGTETEAPPAIPATDPLAPEPAAATETDPLAPPPAEPAAEPATEPAATPPAEPESAIRTWIDASGQHKIKAELVSFEDGKVTLKKEDGNLTVLPLEKLSEADQEYLKSLEK